MDKILELEKSWSGYYIDAVNPDLDTLVPNWECIDIKINLSTKILFSWWNEQWFIKILSFFLKWVKSKRLYFRIVLDTANRERIDGIYLCDQILKIDHHIVVDSYGDINIEDEKLLHVVKL